MANLRKLKGLSLGTREGMVLLSLSGGGVGCGTASRIGRGRRGGADE